MIARLRPSASPRSGTLTLSKDDALTIGAQVMRRAVIATDMRTLGKAIGEFYLELLETLRNGGLDDEDASNEAFSMTANLMSEFISVGLHMEQHDEVDDE